MLLHINNLFMLLEVAKEEEEETGIGPAIMGVLKKIWEEVLDLFEGFVDFFELIKHYTYDALAEKFGYTGVTILFAMIIIVLIMIIVTAIIRK